MLGIRFNLNEKVVWKDGREYTITRISENFSHEILVTIVWYCEKQKKQMCRVVDIEELQPVYGGPELVFPDMDYHTIT